jgi:hypothetical protein
LSPVKRVSLDAHEKPEIRNGMILGQGGGQVDIGFNSPSFVAPEGIRIRYRLVGVDRDWVEARSRRSANYSNLNPGKYRFEVWAENNDGVSSTHTSSFDFEILPRFYQTYWFRGLAAICAGLVIWTIYISRVKYLVRSLGDHVS